MWNEREHTRLNEGCVGIYIYTHTHKKVPLKGISKGIFNVIMTISYDNCSVNINSYIHSNCYKFNKYKLFQL